MRAFVSRGPLPVAAAALAGLVACALFARPLPDRLQAALDGRVRRCEAMGASAAVVLPGGTLWRGASGLSHDAVAMAPEMAFAVGSITKNMVAALALQLAEEGKLSLEDPIGRWLPPYPHVDPAITIRQMLDHSSGLFMFWDNQAIWDDLLRDRTKVFTPEDVLGYLREPYFPPGQGHHYSNTNYLLAAMILTRVTASPLSTQLRRRFWGPLGLSSACLPPEEPYPDTLAHVWGDNFEKGGPHRDVTFLPRTSHDTIGYGSSGVFMTAEDLARWTHALFHGRVVGPRSLAQMQAFGPEGGYGLGLHRLEWGVPSGLEAVGHGGGNIGTTAYMAYLPDHDVSIAVMVNRFGGSCASLIVRDLARTAAWHLGTGSFLELWGFEALLGALWLVAGAGALVWATRRDQPFVPLILGGLAIGAGWVSAGKGVTLDVVLFPEGTVLVLSGLALLLRRRRRPA